MTPQLFGLPEYDRAFSRFVNKAIHELMSRKNPVLGMIKTVPAPQVPLVRNTMSSGEVVENRPIMVEMPFAVNCKDAIMGNSESLIAAIDNAAEEGLKKIMPQFYEYLGRLCQAAGTGMDARGQELSHDLIRKSLENVDIEFDDEGRPIMPTLVMHPVTAEKLRRLPPPTEDQARAFKELIDKKREQYNDRRRYRKLS